MKGTDLPMNFLAVLVLCLIIIVALAMVLNKSGSETSGQAELIQEHSDLCGKYSELGCNISKASWLHPGLQNDLKNVCKSLGYISSDATCSDFDNDCGRPCCRSYCQ